MRESAAIVAVAVCLYATVLLVGAGWAHRRRTLLEGSRFRLPIYALSLAVYCTSWTYFGAVGSAVANGWSFLPIYLGPMLVVLAAPGVLPRLIAAVREEGATSVSDFIAARFGSSRAIAAGVTLIALLASIPYLALQLRSVGLSYALTARSDDVVTPMLIAAACLAAFAIVFGVRRYAVAVRNEAVLFAVAVESLVKLVALCLAAGFAAWLVWGLPEPVRAAGLARLADNFAVQSIGGDFLLVTALSMAAFLCLPRQFYVGVSEARAPGDARSARWILATYMMVTVAAVLPIALAGLALPELPGRVDFLSLSLPLSAGADGLAILVFLGGLSAALAMAVTESIALSTMISNDLVAPFLLRRRDSGNLGRTLLWVRRAAILLLMGAAVAYALLIPDQAPLASVGLVAFAAVAQYAPILLVAIWRRDNDSVAGVGGLAAGMLVWIHTLFLPTVGMGMPSDWTEGTLLDPRALFGIAGLSPIVHGTLLSLGANLSVAGLLNLGRASWRRPLRPWAAATARGIATRGALADLTERFVGVEEAAQLRHEPSAPVDAGAAAVAERQIAGVVGASSARAIMASALSGQGLGLADIAALLDASGKSLRFSRELLAATLENIDPGVSVIDSAQRLVAWNQRYLTLFDYPPGLVRVGAPVADLIRFNAERGACGPGEVESHVVKRLEHMRDGSRHAFERRRPDGRVVKSVGGPMPDGGYVMCFTDVTAESQALAAVEEARAELEARVAARTAELREANARLARATAEKTRFLAAASHDLLQPLHAARLFAEALRRKLPEDQREAVTRIDRSIVAANDLLGALLDISKLDAGGIVPQPEPVRLRPLLAALAETLEPLASAKGLSLRVGPGDATVRTDPGLLRSIVQNFLSNAIRYTRQGGVLAGVRQRGGVVWIEIWDTGIGIAADQHTLIFREFERLGTAGEAGVGLGLAIAKRSATLIGARITLASVPGRGSCFALGLGAPLATPIVTPPVQVMVRADAPSALSLLVVDDDPAIGEAMTRLLETMGHRVATVANGDAALDRADAIDAALVDFHLGDEAEDGLSLIDRLRGHVPGLRAALVTADRDPRTLARAVAADVQVLAKPLDPGDLARWLAQDGAAPARRALNARR